MTKSTVASDAADAPADTPASATDAEERLLHGPAGRLLLATSLGWLAIQAGRLVLSPMLTAVMDDLRISEPQAGFAFTVMWGLYAVGQFPSGRLSDRLSRVTLLVPALALLSVGFLALAAAPTYAWFLAGAVVVGAGGGLYPTTARALLSDLFVRKRGRAFGLHTASGDLGGAAAAGLAVGVLAVATWRVAYLPVVAVVAVVLVLLHRWRRGPYELRRVEFGAAGTARRLLANRRLTALLVAYVLYAFTWQGAVGFLPTFLQNAKGFSPALAGGGFAALFVVGAVVKPVAGTLGDRFPRGLVAAGAMGAGATALGVAVAVPTTGVTVAGVAVPSRVAVSGAVVAFAAGLMAAPPVLQAYLMDLFPDGSMGGDLGAARSAYIGIGSLGPTYVGVVAGRMGYGAAFAGLVACLLVAGALVLVATR